MPVIDSFMYNPVFYQFIFGKQHMYERNKDVKMSCCEDCSVTHCKIWQLLLHVITC